VLRKALVVAQTEISSAVRTKAFLIGVLLMPLLMVGISISGHLLEKRVDTTPKRFAVLDRSGTLYAALARKAGERKVEPAFVPEEVHATGGLDAPGLEELALSERVRKGDLYAFVIIPQDQSTITYYSDHPTYGDLHHWIDKTLNDEIRNRRYRAAGISAEVADKLDAQVPSSHVGLVALGPDGKPVPAEKVDEIRAFVVPLISMMLLFLPVMIAAPQLLNSVIEEKMSRISEVLLGSLSPFELMLGKLLGGAGVSLILAGLYVTGALVGVTLMGVAGIITFGMVISFVVFLALAMLLYGSMYLAIGAACTELKDAQSLMMPVVLMSAFPMMMLMPIIRAPTSSFAVGMSMFPPATPFIMLLRIGLHPAPPMWQVALSIVLCTGFCAVCVFAAGKIFRVGLLSQGKTASFAQMIKWVMAK
jgi:ABC-2 type transport system permease protein